MNSIFRPALVLFAALTLLTGVAYPLLVTVAAQALFPSQAAGSLILRDGKPVGSALIGQNSSDPGHFFKAGPAASRCRPARAHAKCHNRRITLMRKRRAAPSFLAPPRGAGRAAAGMGRSKDRKKPC